jgi:cyclophilin family peptidyl-prolyl cis-trans isomerase/HEAT repeat protein
MVAFSIRVARSVGATAISVLLAGCATAPPVPPPTTIPFETKMSWILRLEDQRMIRDPVPPAVIPVAPAAGGRRAVLPPPPAPSPDLVRLLDDEQPRLRWRAALGLGRVGLPEAVPALTRRLADDPDLDVRQVAAFALGLIGDPSATVVLRQALADGSPGLQGRAAEALALIGDAASAGAIGDMVGAHVRAGVLASVAPDDLTYPLSQPVEATRLGLYALARLKAYDAIAQSVLDGTGQPLVVWWPVAFALQRTQDPRATPALRALARTQTTYTRALAIRGLGELRDRELAPILAPLISTADASPILGIEAIRAAGRLGEPTLSRALAQLAISASAPQTVRAEAIQALGATGAGDAQEALFDLVSDKSPLVRVAVLGTLAKLEADSFVAILSSLEPDPEWTVRAALATVLGTLPNDMATPRLQAMLHDADLRVVPAVLDSLTKLRAPDVESVLRERLTNDDAIVRMAAARNLGDLKPAGGEEALAAAYQFGQRDATYVARAAALAALARYGRAAAVDTLRLALADKEWAVRVRAADLLKSIDPAAAVAEAIRPAPESRPAQAYEARQLVAPDVSPHVFLDTDKGTIEIEMAVLDAPLTAANFMALARSGFFEGLSFHRVEPNFVIQAGDPRGDGEGGPGYTIRDELNEAPYVRGAVGMALDWRDTGGSQFFITHAPQPQLDGRYTLFGRVVSGMDVVDRIEQGDVIRRVRAWDGVVLSAR